MAKFSTYCSHSPSPRIRSCSPGHVQWSARPVARKSRKVGNLLLSAGTYRAVCASELDLVYVLPEPGYSTLFSFLSLAYRLRTGAWKEAGMVSGMYPLATLNRYASVAGDRVAEHAAGALPLSGTPGRPAVFPGEE